MSMQQGSKESEESYDDSSAAVSVINEDSQEIESQEPMSVKSTTDKAHLYHALNDSIKIDKIDSLQESIVIG